VKVKGFRISCKEVEECLQELPQVSEAAVIGVPDPEFGEVIKAYIVPEEIEGESFIEEASKHLGRTIGANRIPQEWRFRKSLPKNSSGKIMKEILKKEQS
jgi:acyl-coenzyme A synthetase/AMP-(fatty) acid ligase